MLHADLDLEQTDSKCRNRRSPSHTQRLPFSLWRFATADAFDRAAVRALRDALHGVSLAHIDGWSAAASGDASAAIGIALRMHRAPTLHAGFDFAMTAVVACAAEGDATACLVASHIVRTGPAADRGSARIATSWLVRAFRAAAAEASNAEAAS